MKHSLLLFKILLLASIVGATAGCVSSDDQLYTPTESAASPHDDSHGWGTTISTGAGH